MKKARGGVKKGRGRESPKKINTPSFTRRKPHGEGKGDQGITKKAGEMQNKVDRARDNYHLPRAQQDFRKGKGGRMWFWEKRGGEGEGIEGPTSRGKEAKERNSENAKKGETVGRVFTIKRKTLLNSGLENTRNTK